MQLDKKLKIAIIGSRGYPYVYSGYETLVKELSERLVKKGHSVRVYCHSSLFKKKPKYVNGVELVYTPSIETKFLSQIVNSFFSFIHVCFSNFNVVLVVNSANGPFGILTKIFRKNTCINVDGLEWLRPKWKGLGSYYFKISSRLSTILFDRVITDSNEMQKIYYKKFGIKSNVIAYGSTMVKTTKKNILEKFNIKEKEYYLIIGRLIPDNNSKLILDGFLNSYSKKKLVIVGDSPFNDTYANSVKSLASDRLVLTGYINSQSDLTQLYKYSFCYIHGHEFGGTNPTMVNAIDLNCNIIALDTCFNKEMLSKKKFILFKKNKKSVINAVNTMENQSEKLIISNINYKLPKVYDWNLITKQYIEEFKNFQNT